jgi:hypothetical protein
MSAGATLLRNYQKGTRLIQALAATKYRVEIREVRAEEMQINPATGQRFPPVSMCGSSILGNRIEVQYSPDKTFETKVWRSEKKKTTEWELLPKHIELGHEFLHALLLVALEEYRQKCRLQKLVCRSPLGNDEMIEYFDVTGRRRKEKVSAEHCAVIGLGARKEGRLTRLVTENLLRAETRRRPGSGGRPRQRVGYEGRDPITQVVY